MALVRLGKFCSQYARQYGSAKHLIYGSLYAAIQGGKVEGEKIDGYWHVNPQDATRWLKNKRAAVPPPSPYTPNFHIEPDSPFQALFVDMSGAHEGKED